VIDQAPQIFADDLTVGQVFLGQARRIGDDQFRAFADMTGDDHPIHYDDAYAARTRFGKRLAHGLLVMSMTALGATPISRQIEDAMVAFVEEGARFIKPVFVGDTLTSRFEVAAIDPKPARVSPWCGSMSASQMIEARSCSKGIIAIFCC